ncbi:MAG: DUF2889 domain-containing protein [Burkholderiaceae bacterium]|jgi:hypothetical protein|nr:DUF2889 domain-containing protein [Burkholderiaceae bacterium]
MRKLLHTRQVTCQGYERDDGLWDIEGRLSDVKTYDLRDGDGPVRLPAGQPLHLMTLTLTVNASFDIVAAQANIARAPNAECKDIPPAYSALVGLRIGPGFIGAIKKRFKGPLGCTHLSELLGPMATTAFQTLWPHVARKHREQNALDLAAGKTPRLAMLDTCYAMRSGGEVARMRWPMFHRANGIADSA